MLLLIDNYDSFTYNLVQYFGELGEEVRVFRNDCITPEQITELKPDYLVISPGPCTPDQAGVSVPAILHCQGRLPILGVCLGHQGISRAYGGRIVRAAAVMHGKTSPIHHDGNGLFKNLQSPFTATRYHSLVADPQSLPDCLEVTAWSLDPEGNREAVMGIRHREQPTHGVQFHPESILTEHGHELLRNFLEMGT